MPECEFKEWCEILTGQTSFCTEEEYEKMGKDYCEDIERFRQFFNSPQFKKQYADINEVVERIESHKQALMSNMKTAGYELTKEKDYIEGLVMAQNLIRTHGLEE